MSILSWMVLVGILSLIASGFNILAFSPDFVGLDGERRSHIFLEGVLMLFPVISWVIAIITLFWWRRKN